ncbi:MAG: hypothetical protein JWM12_3527, partial [Ilumatobacteraceae bacterium]|nr:hypothetical protein [Ilumatobacteraceae bacterium]
MSCPTCGAATQPGQRFCKDCGFALVADARPGLPPPGALRWNDDPDARAAAIVPTAPSAAPPPPPPPP